MPRPSSVRVSEKSLCVLWRRQRWDGRKLVLADGRFVDVVYAGRHTFDHGPDFRDALLVFADELVRGDVELHVSAADWRHHGHQDDPRYDGVILHVVWHDDTSSAVTAARRELPVLALEDQAGIDRAALEEVGRMELSLPRLPGFEPPCHGHSDAVLLLSALGEERLLAKAAVFEAALADRAPAQVFYTALLDASGFAANREPSRRLSDRVPWQVLAAATAGVKPGERIVIIEALLLGAAGLLPSRQASGHGDFEDDPYVAELCRRWHELNRLWRIAPLDRREWRFSRVRPENYPPRRLSGLAHLIAPYTQVDLPGAFLGVIASEDVENIPTALEAVLAAPAVGYWSVHYDFGRPAKAATQLLGRDRAADIAVNVVLPFAIAYGEFTGDRRLVAQARSAYLAYPRLADNELSRYVARLVFASRCRGIRACHQQGLLHAYHKYCREKRCFECVLATGEKSCPN